MPVSTVVPFMNATDGSNVKASPTTVVVVAAVSTNVVPLVMLAMVSPTGTPLPETPSPTNKPDVDAVVTPVPVAVVPVSAAVAKPVPIALRVTAEPAVTVVVPDTLVTVGPATIAKAAGSVAEPEPLTFETVTGTAAESVAPAATVTGTTTVVAVETGTPNVTAGFVEVTVTAEVPAVSPLKVVKVSDTAVAPCPMETVASVVGAVVLTALAAVVKLTTVDQPLPFVTSIEITALAAVVAMIPLPVMSAAVV
jgi:hypothetical protein